MLREEWAWGGVHTGEVVSETCAKLWAVAHVPRVLRVGAARHTDVVRFKRAPLAWRRGQLRLADRWHEELLVSSRASHERVRYLGYQPAGHAPHVQRRLRVVRLVANGQSARQSVSRARPHAASRFDCIRMERRLGSRVPGMGVSWLVGRSSMVGVAHGRPASVRGFAKARWVRNGELRGLHM